MLRKFGISGNFGNSNFGNSNFGNVLIGNATGTGKNIGDFFKFLRITAALAILASFRALSAFKPAIFNATFRFAARNGAVKALHAASFVAFAYHGSELWNCCKYDRKVKRN